MQHLNMKKELSIALGKVIKRLRDENNQSSRNIAYGVNLSKTTLLLAEKGQLDPQLSTFCKLATAFYKTPTEFINLVINELPFKWDEYES